MPKIDLQPSTDQIAGGTKKRLKVLSLSDGTSGWQSILKANNKKPNVNYEAYVSEIDPFAIKFVKMNYPDSVQFGDMRNVRGHGYDAIIGGTPCVNLSSLGRRDGLKDITTGEILDTPEKYFAAKSAGHEVTPSSLLYEFKRILDEARESGNNPKFMLENVASMNNNWRDLISNLMGVEPIRSRSRGIQPRKRYFWTNIMDQSEYDDIVYSKPKTYVKDLLDFDAPRKPDPTPRLVVSKYPFNSPTLVTSGKYESSSYLIAGNGDEIPTLNTRSAIRVYKDGVSYYPTSDDYVRLHLEGIGDPTEIRTDGLSAKQLGRMLGNGWSHVDVSPLIVGLFK